MFKAQISTRWTVIDGENQPAFLGWLANRESWVDVTWTPAVNIPPTPNVVVLEMIVSEATLAALDDSADTVVLWSKEIVDGE